MSFSKRIVFSAVCIALCVVLPMAFHAIPGGGSVFLPMHIPVLLCGLICGWPFGLACGLAGPLLSSLLTGMPPAAYLPKMLCELAVYGFASGLFAKLIYTKNFFADMYISLIASMLLGRIIAGILSALIFASGKYSMAAWTTAYFVKSFPGIIIQIVLIPLIVFALEKSKLIPKRY